MVMGSMEERACAERQQASARNTLAGPSSRSHIYLALDDLCDEFLVGRRVQDCALSGSVRARVGRVCLLNLDSDALEQCCRHGIRLAVVHFFGYYLRARESAGRKKRSASERSELGFRAGAVARHIRSDRGGPTG